MNLSWFSAANPFLILKVYPAFAPMLQEEPRQRPEGEDYRERLIGGLCP
jgi:hypothetical protein